MFYYYSREMEYQVTTSASQLNEEFFRIVKKAKTLSTRGGRATVTNSDTEYEFILLALPGWFRSLETICDLQCIYGMSCLRHRPCSVMISLHYNIDLHLSFHCRRKNRLPQDSLVHPVEQSRPYTLNGLWKVHLTDFL